MWLFLKTPTNQSLLILLPPKQDMLPNALWITKWRGQQEASGAVVYLVGLERVLVNKLVIINLY